AISILMICFTLLLGLRLVLARPSGPQRQDEREARADTSAWWRRFWIPVFLVAGASIWLMFEVPGDAVTLLITISTVAFLGVYASLSRAGLATRREVGTRAGAAMFFLVGLSMQLATSHRSFGISIWGGWLVPLVLVIGGSLCLYLGKAGGGRKGIGVLPVAATLGGVILGPRRYLLMGGLAVCAIVGFQFMPLGQKEATPEAVRAWLSTYEDGSRVEDLDQTVINFLAAAEAPLDLRALARAGRERLDRELEHGTFNSLYASAFARLGFLEDEDYRHFVDQRAIDKLLSPARMSRNGEHVMPEILAHLRFDSFTLEERNLIADKAMATLDPANQYANAEHLQWIVHLLDALDLPGRLDELAPAVDEILQATWCRTVNGEEAAFSTYRDNIERDESGESVEKRLTFVWGHATSTSVWLMSRFGFPEWMSASDLGALDAYLSDKSHYYPRSGISPFEAETVSARALLHTTKAWAAVQAEVESSRSLFNNLFRLRAVIAAVLLAAFSVLLTWRAPEELPAV
ncbi:MAG: hypothetical protein QGI83_24920, partial [Candidatus Latescibacteria bacterium]|nr:hypothetical protein [Candidatus Latescibacterota bacterium]